MIELDAFAPDMEGREFRYTLPKPFGPDRGEAELVVTARPAGAQNEAYVRAVDDIMLATMKADILREKEADGDKVKDLEIRSENSKLYARKGVELLYDTCVVSWETTIQSKNSNILSTRENFVELAMFNHPEVKKVFDQIKIDLGDYSKFASAAEAEAAEAERKN